MGKTEGSCWDRRGDGGEEDTLSPQLLQHPHTQRDWVGGLAPSLVPGGCLGWSSSPSSVPKADTASPSTLAASKTPPPPRRLLSWRKQDGSL